MRYYPTLFDRGGVEEWIVRNRRRYAANGHGLWAMILKSTGELIGDCGVTVQTVDGVDELEIGYHLSRDCWGRGYATEAAQACRDWAFVNRNADYVVSLIRPENLASCRVAERNGMTLWKEIIWRELVHPFTEWVGCKSLLICENGTQMRLAGLSVVRLRDGLPLPRCDGHDRRVAHRRQRSQEQVV